MSTPTVCPIHERLSSIVETLLKHYTSEWSELYHEYGADEAKSRTERGRQDYLRAQKNLEDHDKDHGCT